MDDFEKALIIAQKISTDDMAKIIALRKETKRLSCQLRKKYPKMLERMSLVVLWEYDNQYWSDCPHAEDLKYVIFERLMEQKILKNGKVQSRK